MVNILKKIMLSLGIHTKLQAAIFFAVVGIIFVILFVFILWILRRRKYRKIINVNIASDKETGDKPPEDSYEPIIRRIKQVRKKYQSILFASVETESLPVTIPVNVAMGLAKNKTRCLLIDLDLRRDAVAKAFGFTAEQSGLRAKAVQTEIENLWVWPGHYFSRLKQMNVAEITERALDKFDCILINAPGIINSPDRKQIILASRAAFICTKNASSEDKKLTELIKPLDCRIIGRIQVS